MAGVPRSGHDRVVTTPAPERALRRATHALLYGNFSIGCGVMVVAGSLNDLARDLGISVALAGQLISLGAVAMALGAPTLAAVVSGFDRRRLLALTLVWFGLGHALCALAPHLPGLAAVRVLTVLGAAVFTPQAAAAVGHMSAPATRGRAITTIFLGWSLSSVIGMPIHSFVAETVGWRWAFGVVAGMSLLGAAWVWRVLPDGIRPAALSGAQWRSVLTSPVLMAIVAVTACSSAGQFSLFSYLAPYYRQVLHATPTEISLLFLGYGFFGVVGNVMLTRTVDRIGPVRAVTLALGAMLVGLLIWPLAASVAAVAVLMIPWALGCFSSNSAQQARLAITAPVLAPALMALNSSAIYLGQAIGASSGGLWLLGGHWNVLSWWGAGWLVLALALSAWAARQVEGGRPETIPA